MNWSISRSSPVAQADKSFINYSEMEIANVSSVLPWPKRGVLRCIYFWFVMNDFDLKTIQNYLSNEM